MTNNGNDKGAKKKFVYYPGCSSQGSSKHLDQSLRSVVPALGLEMEEIDDWNCCGASVGNIGGGPLPTTASDRTQPGQGGGTAGNRCHHGLRRLLSEYPWSK